MKLSPPCQLSATEDSLRLAGSSHKELLDVHQRSLKERVAEVDQLQAEADRMRAERMQAVAEVNSQAVVRLTIVYVMHVYQYMC